jgi:hypothetical protein
VTHSLLRTNPILAAPEVSDPASRSQVYA